MRLLLYFILSVSPLAIAAGQAPQAATLWDIPATTLTSPPALETGATAAFWNPAAVLGSHGFTIGAQAIQTPEVLGLNGMLLGLGEPLTSRLSIGLIFGRVEISDLVRTSTSPIAEPGSIPVYEQMGGIAVGARIGPASIGGLVRGHDARFDVFREAGLSADLGVRMAPVRGLTVAAATRFAPVRPGARAPARYYAGIEYRTIDAPLWGTPTAMVARYGVLTRGDGALEHTAGAGVELASRVTVDAAVTREDAFGDIDWRTVLGVGIRAGRFDIVAARGSGLRGIGANFRAGLEVDFGR